ncbi:MAG TPA: alpha/beta fold hydrolase [Streptosporangiaceae bacterium]
MDEHPGVSVTSVPTRLGPLRVEAAGSGAPAVLWHSLFVDSTTWVRVRPPLASVRRLLLIDAPGHGHNPPVARRFTLDDCAGAAADVLDHFRIGGPVDWVGNAMGGHVGIPFAAAYPGRCRSLATIGSPIHALTPPERRKIAVFTGLYRLTGPLPPLVSLLIDALLGPHARTGDPQAAALAAAAFRRATRRGMSRAIGSVSLHRPDLTPLLGKISTPTLICAAADDPSWTPADAARAAGRLPNGASVILPGAGHIAPLFEAEPALAELLTAFWANPDAVITRQRAAAAPHRPTA